MCSRLKELGRACVHICFRVIPRPQESHRHYSLLPRSLPRALDEGYRAGVTPQRLLRKLGGGPQYPRRGNVTLQL